MSRPALLLLRQTRRPARQRVTERAVDRLLGVSRRRRQLAYVAIGGGLAVLRPLLRRAAVLAFATAVVVAVAAIS